MTQAMTGIIDRSLLQQEEHMLYEPAAERGFLACIMREPGLLVEGERLVDHRHLFCGVGNMHAYIYRIMLFVAKTSLRQGWPINFDEVTVLGVVRNCGPKFVEEFWRKTEGMTVWREIAAFSQYASTDQFHRYIQTIRDRAARVAMYRKARQMQVGVMDMAVNADAGKLASQFEGDLSRIAFGVEDDFESRPRQMGAYADIVSRKARMNAAFADKHLMYLPNKKFAFLMNLMGGGLRRRSLTILAARTKVGKTTLLLDLGKHWAMDRIPVLFLDNEMSGEEMASREMSSMAQMDEHQIISGAWVKDGRAEEIERAIASLKQAPLWYVNIAGRPAEYATSIMRQFRNDIVGTEKVQFEGETHTISNPCVVLYDWIKIPSVGDLSNAVKEHQALGDITSKLKDAAKTLDLPIIAGAQQNRGAVGKEDADHEANAEAYIANSDRLAQFCSTLCVLRDLSPTMKESMRGQLPEWHRGAGERALVPPPGANGVVSDYDERATWRFNQLLQVVLQRQGREYRRGIPMFLNRGMSSYQEVSDAESLNFMREFCTNSKQRSKRTKNTPLETAAAPFNQHASKGQASDVV